VKKIFLKKFFIIIFAISISILSYNCPLDATIVFYPQEEDIPSGNVNYYRRIIGEPTKEIYDLFHDKWEYKSITYELFYDNRVSLAAEIYDLAIFTKDITSDMPLERFEKGVQGFHYSVTQVCDWINNNKQIFLNPPQRQLFFYLLVDGIIQYANNKAVPTGNVKHILGVSPGNRRSMESAARHERFHVIWDENSNIRTEYTQKWQNMTPEEHDEIAESLRGYSLENESQLLEEWAVRSLENSKNHSE
jgi:hypothetical protein